LRRTLHGLNQTNFALALLSPFIGRSVGRFSFHTWPQDLLVRRSECAPLGKADRQKFAVAISVDELDGFIRNWSVVFGSSFGSAGGVVRGGYQNCPVQSGRARTPAHSGRTHRTQVPFASEKIRVASIAQSLRDCHLLQCQVILIRCGQKLFRPIAANEIRDAVRTGNLPVMMLARVGEQTGHAAYPCVNLIPLRANASILGVS
jgi:hypothetical protein